MAHRGLCDRQARLYWRTVAALLSIIWTEYLQYDYREAHTVEVESTCVTLRAVTQIAPSDLWVTAEVRVKIPPGSN
jgi:hypothetical protein